MAGLATEAVAASFGPPGGPASLILPADSAWLETKTQIVMAQKPVRPAPLGPAVDAAAKALKAAAKPVILLGGPGLPRRSPGPGRAPAVRRLRSIATPSSRANRAGPGAFQPKKMQYFGEMALAELEGDVDLMVFAGTTQPVAFFAYPNRPSVLVPEGCATMTLAARTEDAVAGLAALADAPARAKAGPKPTADAAGRRAQAASRPPTPSASIARHMPQGRDRLRRTQ